MADALSDFEQLCLRIRGVLADDSIEFAALMENARLLSSPRRIAFIPTRFGTEPVQQANVGFGIPDSIYADYQTVECWISGESYADATAIRHRVLTAVRTVMRANAEPTTGLVYYSIYEARVPQVLWQASTLSSIILQTFVWMINVPRLDDGYLANVKQIDIVDRTQITTTVDGVLTPDDELSIK